MLVMKKFLKAVKKGDEGQVTRLLNAQPLHSTLLEKATSEGKRPLAVAIEHGQLGMVRLLVRRGANLSATDRQDRAALHLAASMGHEEVVSFLLSQEAQATTVARTPLMLASEKGHLGVVQLLVQHREGQGLDERDKGGWTALHWAAHEGHAEVINFLLSKGTRDGNTADSTRLTPLQLAGARDHNTAARTMKVTPLQLACQRGHVGVVQELVQHWGERALHELGQGTQAALQWALNGGHEELVAFLLRTGMKLSKVFTVGKWTPLMMACMCNHLGVVKVLVQHMRAHELERTDDEGMTALHLAAVLGRPEVAAFLLSQGAQANSTSKSHKTPLMHASIEGHLGVVRAFVQHQGAYGLHNTDERGMTALHWAALNGHEEVTKRLLLAGADSNRTDSRGMTARAFAVVRGHTSCVAAFEWWEGELERHYLLTRAMCLRKTFTVLRDQPTSPAPTYLEARVAAGHAVPNVKVGVIAKSVDEKEEEEAGTSGQTGTAGEGDDAQGPDVEKTKHAFMKYVLRTLNESLLTELLEGFHSG